jgi:hypothetical protein
MCDGYRPGNVFRELNLRTIANDAKIDVLA